MKQGKLYVVATPIGNLKDITLRALEKLDEVEVLICEDTRVTGNLLSKYRDLGYIENKPRLVAMNEFNESKVYEQLTGMVAEQIVGLVSDAGMPTISDPGYRVVREALDRGYEVEVIPGPSALTSGLAYSGVGGEIAIYVGFLPKTAGKARKILEAAKAMLEKTKSGRVVLYVSPYRLLKDLKLILDIFGNQKVVLMRELTKMHEERVEDTIENLASKYEKGVKGELVLVIPGPGQS